MQLDFTEGRLSLKLDPGGQLLEQFIALNNQVLERFTEAERARIGGFSPFADDTSTSRDTAFAKIASRIEGTALAAQQLGL